MANITEVTVWKPPDTMSLKVIEGGAGGSFQHSYALISQHGGTEFTIKIEMELAGIFRLLSGIAIRQTKKLVEAELQTLKTQLEG